MKKLMVLAAVVSAALFGQAAAVDWLYTAAGEADVDKVVYALVGDTAQTSWESLLALETAAAGNPGTVVKVGRSGYSTTGSAKDAAITPDSANIYFVIVSADKETFDVTTVADMKSMVYDPDNQGTSPGQFDGLSSANIFSTGNKFGSTPPGPEPTPEPTSGLLLVLGVAGLALRRRHA